MSYYSRMSEGLTDWVRRQRHYYAFTNPLADNFCADASCSLSPCLAGYLLFVFSALPPFIRYPFFCLFPFLLYRRTDRPCLAKRTRLHCGYLAAGERRASACGGRRWMRARSR